MSSSDFRTQLGAQLNLFSLANGRVRPIQDYPPVGLLDPISGTRKEIPFAEFCSQLTALEEGVISPLFFAAKTHRVTKGSQKVIRGPFGTFYRPRQQEVYGTILDFIPNFDHLASDAIERDPQWAISVRAMSASSTPSLPSRTHTAAISDAGASPLGFIDDVIWFYLHRRSVVMTHLTTAYYLIYYSNAMRFCNQSYRNGGQEHSSNASTGVRLRVRIFPRSDCFINPTHIWEKTKKK